MSSPWLNPQHPVIALAPEIDAACNRLHDLLADFIPVIESARLVLEAFDAVAVDLPDGAFDAVSQAVGATRLHSLLAAVMDTADPDKRTAAR